MKKIYVNCGGELQVFDNKKQVMDFYEDCIMMSEGSERERYTEIYFSVKENLNTDERCFTDGTDHVYNTRLKPEDIDYEDEMLLYDNYGVDKKELLFYQAKNYLANSHERIFKSTYDRYYDLNDLYKNYLSDKSENSFYYFGEDTIVCIDTSATPPDNYWVEEFPLEDFEYADKWLKGEMEYSDYLKTKNKDNMELS